MKLRVGLLPGALDITLSDILRNRAAEEGLDDVQLYIRAEDATLVLLHVNGAREHIEAPVELVQELRSLMLAWAHRNYVNPAELEMLATARGCILSHPGELH